jgi:hypothetical protein
MSDGTRHDPDPARLPARFCEWLAAALTHDAVRCTDVRFEIPGTLQLSFERAGRPVSLRLVAGRDAPPESVPAPDAALVPFEPAAATDWRELAAWVARRLQRIRARYHVPLLELFRDDDPREPHTFDAGLFHGRLGPLFVPGTTRCGAWVFADEAFDGQALTYGFESAAGRVEVRVHDTPDHPDAWLRTPHLSATLAQDERSPAERSPAEARVERYVGFLLTRCDAPGATYRRRAPSRRAFVDDRPGFDARLDGQFFVREIGHDYLNIYQAFWGLDLPVDLLIHGDRECAGMGTHCPGPIFRPWATTLDVRPDVSKVGRVAFTALRDTDLIGGGEGRLRASLEAMDREAPGRLLVVMDTCVPQVIGDDVERVVSEHQATGARPLALISCRMEEHTPLRGPQAFWLSVLRQLADEPARDVSPSVNLVGYGRADAPAVRELSALLDRLGVAVNAVLFPGLTEAHARRFRNTRASVVNPWPYVARLFEPIAAWSGRPVLTPGMPYGVEGTARWARQVAQAVTGSQPPELPVLAPDALAEWDRLRGLARGHTVAFATLSTQLDLPADEALTQGIPLLATLLEMGFRVALHCLDTPELRGAVQRREPGPAFEALSARFDVGERLVTHTWTDLAALHDALAAPGVSLVYSELVADPRLRALGKAQLAPTDLQPGAMGALATLRELIRRASDPFRARYADLLANGGARP